MKRTESLKYAPGSSAYGFSEGQGNKGQTLQSFKYGDVDLVN